MDSTGSSTAFLGTRTNAGVPICAGPDPDRALERLLRFKRMLKPSSLLLRASLSQYPVPGGAWQGGLGHPPPPGHLSGTSLQRVLAALRGLRTAGVGGLETPCTGGWRRSQGLRDGQSGGQVGSAV